MKQVLSAAFCLALGAVTVLAATIGQIGLSEGVDAINRITSPVYDTVGIAPLDIGALAANYDRKAKFVRRTGGRLPATRGPEYDLDQRVDLGALLTEALNNEATTMGFRRAAESESWRISGSLKDIYLESRQVYMGATLFYGYMDVELEVRGPSGQAMTRRMRLHNYFGGYNAGFGRRDEAEAAAAHLLVEGAQEIIARLNREFFKAPPHPSMTTKLEGLRTGVDGRLADLRAVGLSGLPAAGPSLLELVSGENDENRRSAIIDALASLASSDAVAALAKRYASEDEDCRWYILKAMDYTGGLEAERFVSSQGAKDKDANPRRLAARITASAVR
jgi:hypothetical protein